MSSRSVKLTRRRHGLSTHDVVVLAADGLLGACRATAKTDDTQRAALEPNLAGEVLEAEAQEAEGAGHGVRLGLVPTPSERKPARGAWAYTYVVDGVAALDVAGVAVAATEDGRGGGRKEREGEEGEGSSTSEHGERVWGLGKE